MLMCLVLGIYTSLTEVMGTTENVCALLSFRPGFGSFLLGFFSNYTQSFRGKVGDNISQPFIPFRSGMSPLENVQFPLDVEHTTFPLCYLVGFPYMVCGLSKMRAEIFRVVQTPAPVVEKSEWCGTWEDTGQTLKEFSDPNVPP